MRRLNNQKLKALHCKKSFMQTENKNALHEDQKFGHTLPDPVHAQTKRLLADATALGFYLLLTTSLTI